MSANPSNPGPSQPPHRLAELRRRLLALHKTLIDSERVTYEQTFGPVTSPQQFLHLLVGDPWFAWLHPLSELVVAIDERLDEAEAPLTPQHVTLLTTRTRELLQASEAGSGFPRSYFEALQRDPDVVLAHAEVARWLRGA